MPTKSLLKTPAAVTARSVPWEITYVSWLYALAKSWERRVRYFEAEDRRKALVIDAQRRLLERRAA